MFPQVLLRLLSDHRRPMPEQSDTFTIDQLQREISPDQTAEFEPLPETPVPLPETACLIRVRPHGPGVGRLHTLGPVPITIGRDPDCEIPAPDDAVSRRHAGIERQPDGSYHIIDLGSRNGTAVNGTRVQAAILRDRDLIRIGGCEFRFRDAGAAAAAAEAELYQAAVMDPLTGAHNRRAFEEFLAREVSRSQRHARPLSLLLFDVDRFKLINDRFGHPAGDYTLRELAAVVKGVIRTNDLLARYGGDEFVVVLPETPPTQGARCGERIRAALAAHTFTFAGRTYPVAISVGVGGWEPGVTPAELVARADRRLYEAKRGGRDRVCG